MITREISLNRDVAVLEKNQRQHHCVCEGIAACLMVMEKDEKEIRGILDWFKDSVINDIEKHKAALADKPARKTRRQ